MKDWIELAIAACDHAGIRYNSIEILATWDQKYCANSVYRLDNHRYLKLYGPRGVRQFYIEQAVLQLLEAHPVISAPRIIASAERSQDAPYLVLSGISGATAENVWDGIVPAERLPIAEELGKITAAIHRLPQKDLIAVESKFGDRYEHIIVPEQSHRIAEIKGSEMLSVRQRDKLLRFLQEEAQEYLASPLKITHFDLAHNHIYLSRETGRWQVNGIIDWGEAVIGPPEWDVVYLWHWTFTTITQDREAMRVCLQSFFGYQPRPERFARRCFAALLFTPSMALLWPPAAAQAEGSRNIVRDLIKYFYPSEIFGPPD
jgi:aminoglycoside phosphotransferase (APT) family kinase protein